ncbi:MAG: prepilin-type N-terminal cleavage/methylation domain-containing protein [Verrucomicrobia bacterium]|nr:prepilin-type N-terminal cleavage/methylation domain-containing protein [Verrucomicrobiota bacterium]
MKSRCALKYRYRHKNEAGLTLVELLVVLAIIATLAGIIYPAIIDSFQKSQAAMAAQRIDAVEKAKVQFRLDNPNATTAGFSDLQPYLVQLGQPVSSVTALDDGTGGTINIGDLTNTAYFTPANANAKFAQLLSKYHIPTTSRPEGDAVVSAAAGNPVTNSTNP